MEIPRITWSISPTKNEFSPFSAQIFVSRSVFCERQSRRAEIKRDFRSLRTLVFDHFINSLKRKRTIIQLTQRGRERKNKNEKKREKKILKGFPGSSRFSSMNRLPFRRLDIPLGLIRSISGDFCPCFLWDSRVLFPFNPLSNGFVFSQGCTSPYSTFRRFLLFHRGRDNESQMYPAIRW